MIRQPRALRQKLSRRDAALVAAALLLPIPLFAQSGLSIPLPGAVERGLGSLITLDSDDGRTGSRATGQASTESQGERQSGRASFRMARGRRAITLLESVNPSTPDAGSADGFDRPAGDSGSGSGGTSAGSGPEGAGGGAGSPADSENPGSQGTGDPAGNSGEGGATAPAPAPESKSTLSVTGPGSSADLSAGEDGIGIDVAADDSGADGDEAGVGVDVTQADGSSTGIGVTVPGTGVTVP